MNTLETIDLTYKYLRNVYDQTCTTYVKKNLIKSENLIGLNINSLIKHSFLIEHKNSVNWIGVKPQISYAYDYYYSVRKKKKKYENILNVLKNPNNFEVDEIIEAIAIKGMQDSYINPKIDNSNITIPAIINNNLLKSNHSEINSNKHQQPENSTTELIENLLMKLNNFEIENKLMIELMHQIVHASMENTDKVISSQNSISTTIAILKTNQENLFDISATQFYLLSEKYAEINESVKNNPDNATFKEKLEKISGALSHMRNRINSNTNIVNKYHNKKS
jgi:hypothetical protein